MRAGDHSVYLPRARQKFDGTARFQTQTGEFILREQVGRTHPGQHRETIGAIYIIEYASYLAVAPFDDLEHIEVALVSAPGAVMSHALDLGKHVFTALMANTILGIKIPEMGTKKRKMSSRVAVGSGVGDALFTKVQQRVLAVLFGNPARSFYANELIALAASGTGAVQRELAQLEALRD